ncbi:MAG: J domain-containing protein [Alphaproteobacteria bacterium]|nr:J domain-containing protein [Alphaproteobacteria bacterium]
MTYAEALAILGIDAGTDKKSARRAYLRLVRDHKPEQDPDGFQRVRSAWELVEGRLTASAWAAEPVRRAPPRAPPREPVPVAVHRPPVPAPPTAPPEAPEPPEPPPDEVPVSDEPAPWDVPVPPDADPFTLDDPPSEVPEPAPWDAPPDPDPRAWTVEPWEPESDAPPAPEPDVLAAQALEAAEIDGEIALDALRRACEAALDGHRPEPSISTVLQTVLTLHQAGDAKTANAAWRVASRWIDGSGAGIRIGNHAAVWLALGRELSDLPVHFPAEVRRRIAEAVLEHDPAGAQQDLLALYRSRPHVALDAADLLEAYTPNLHKMFGGFLRDPAGNQVPPPRTDDEQQRGSSGFNPTLLVYLAIVVLTIGLRVCVAGNRSTTYTPSYYTPSPSIYMPPPIEPLDFDVDALLRSYRTTDLNLPTLALCLEGFNHPKEACDIATRLREAAEANDCETALAEREKLLAVPHAPPPPLSEGSDLLDTGAQIQRISKAVDTQCRAGDQSAP